MTRKEIMKDLKEIRYYYSRKKSVKEENNDFYAIKALDKVSRYNDVMKNAPIRVYDVYVNLYMENNTQESLASKWGYSVQTINSWNNQLCQYLLNNLSA